MPKKKNNVNKLSPKIGIEEFKLLNRLDKMLLDGSFEEIIEEAEKAIVKYPNNSFFYMIKSLAHSEINQMEEALKILKKAEKKFPSDYEVFFQLAKIYEEFSDFDNAEKYYLKSYELTPIEYNEERSDCLNDLGALFWRLKLRSTAIEYWQLAVNEYSGNIKAVENLKNCLNKYGKPSFVSELFDDMFQFQEIQTGKYLKAMNKNEFSSRKEIEKVFSIISGAWNKFIAPEKNKLDTYSVEEINKWFESFELDFSTVKKKVRKKKS